MGPMSRDEKIMLATMGAAVCLWVAGDSLGISAGGCCLELFGILCTGRVVLCVCGWRQQRARHLGRWAAWLVAVGLPRHACKRPCAWVNAWVLIVDAAGQHVCLLLSAGRLPPYFWQCLLRCHAVHAVTPCPLCSDHRYDGSLPAAQHWRAALARVPDLPRSMGHAVLVRESCCGGCGAAAAAGAACFCCCVLLPLPQLLPFPLLLLQLLYPVGAGPCRMDGVPAVLQLTSCAANCPRALPDRPLPAGLRCLWACLAS